LYRHFTEALVRATFLKYNYDKLKLIENAENLFHKKFKPMIENNKSENKSADKKLAHFKLLQANEKVSYIFWCMIY
jgi:hypothetical protein